jgi:hypothetical protein
MSAGLPPTTSHEFDDDACCIHCGFDGAEWSWLKRQGHVSQDQQPLCERRPTTPEAVASKTN